MRGRSFDSTWGKDPQHNRFTGEVRVVDLADWVDRTEHGFQPAPSPEERARASSFFRVVFVSALPPLECGSVDVGYRVEKSSGTVTEEIWD